MDMKRTFYNGVIIGEIYVEQPKGVKDPHFPNHVMRSKKALYGLKQAFHAWYERLTMFLLNNGFLR